MEVVWNEGIAKKIENGSLEVMDGMGLAGGRGAGRVRRVDFHISW